MLLTYEQMLLQIMNTALTLNVAFIPFHEDNSLLSFCIMIAML